MGQDSIIHAISNGPDRGVTITPLSARYWERRFSGATRVLPRASQVASLRNDEAIDFAQGTYSGELYNGEPHGLGEMHGAGTFVASSGRDVTGRWEAGERVGGDSPVDASRRTYIRAQDSPWETWDGIVDGDFRAWQQQEQEAFEEFRRRSEPPRTR